MADALTADPQAGTAPQNRGPRLVPTAVNRAKFDEQIARWRANADVYARRGWLLLSVGDLCVEVGFLRDVAMGPRTIPVMTACVRIDYWNFDLWAPSLTFIDPITREPLGGPPPVRAPNRMDSGEVRDALIDQHPETLRPFLCLPGIREYHSHPQHSGDDWLLHRHLDAGDLVVICERIWQRMSRNVLGMSVAIQSLAPGSSAGIANQLDMNLLQGDADLAQRQLAAQEAQEAAVAAAMAAGAASAEAQGPDADHDRPAPSAQVGEVLSSADVIDEPVEPVIQPVMEQEAGVQGSPPDVARDGAEPSLVPAARRKSNGGPDLPT
ncbi:hypothetical protein KDN32_04880 [Nocardioides sp. J2M5]|uniref:putative metal-binding protein n=1 Tax=Nocardioides palaemonis TaxID=2829810 RepID=UPI001BA74CD9|nr:putative metal-binding protein [Nocardioides palaemonis]MBS2937075.1 hypothetical protein [Nocardioides palaemonis]